MAKTIIIDEFHVTVLAPRGFTERQYGSMHGALRGPKLLRELVHSVRNVLRRFPALANARVRVSR
jgi:hypothetical protein